jgi:acyl-coenzyme A thioesterase PaaI-like protein
MTPPTQQYRLNHLQLVGNQEPSNATPRLASVDEANLHLIYPDPDWDARTEAAQALRELGHALVRHRTDETSLAQITEFARRFSAHVATGRTVPRPDDYMPRRYTDDRPPDGARLVAFSDRPISGPANPMGMEVDLRRDGEGVRADVIFGPAFESAPGRTHGGSISAVVDDVMGYLMVVLGVAAYTAELTVRYEAGVPIDTPIRFEAHEVERIGRKLHVELRATAQGQQLVSAKGLFLIAPPESFTKS